MPKKNKTTNNNSLAVVREAIVSQLTEELGDATKAQQLFATIEQQLFSDKVDSQQVV